MATVFECDRCKQLDRGPSQGSGRCEFAGSGDLRMVVCAKCATTIKAFLASPSGELADVAAAARRALKVQIIGRMKWRSIGTRELAELLEELAPEVAS